MKKILLAMCLTFAAVPTFASWGLNKENIVDSCLEKAVGPCEEFRGRSNQTNGSAGTVIWKVGTKRIITWGAATAAANDVIKDKMDFSHTLYANFSACPMEKDIPGHRIAYCVEEVKDAQWKKSNVK